MELFIQIRDGQPFQHPIFADNFRAAFPEVDTNNLPAEFARFERIPAPALGPYEKNQRVQYEIGADGVCRDVWYAEPMSQDEIIAKQEQVKAYWAEHGFASWVFDEQLCEFVPPTPRPDDGKNYMWDEVAKDWIDLSLRGTNPIEVTRV